MQGTNANARDPGDAQSDLRLAELRRLVMQQQGLISQLRAECYRLRTLRLRIATGELADRADMEQELGKQKEFLPVANEAWTKALDYLEAAARKDPDAAQAWEIIQGSPMNHD